MRKTKLQIIEELFDNGYCKDPSTRSLNDLRGCLYENKEGIPPQHLTGSIRILIMNSLYHSR